MMGETSEDFLRRHVGRWEGWKNKAADGLFQHLKQHLQQVVVSSGTILPG